jgi:DNA-binding MurR/RpiR family transcriptional regulator
MMRPNDVAVAISNTGRTRSVIEIDAPRALAAAKLIGVTGSDSPLAAECDVKLIAETLDNTNVFTPTISRIAALVTIDILSTAVAVPTGRRTPEALSRDEIASERVALRGRAVKRARGDESDAVAFATARPRSAPQICDTSLSAPSETH